MTVHQLSERDQRIIVLRKTGLTMAAIGREVGVSKNAVISVIHRYAAELNNPKLGRPIRTMEDRLGALHAKMDALIAVKPPTLKPPLAQKRLVPGTWGAKA